VASIFRNRNFLVAVVGGVLAAIPAALTTGLSIYFHTFMFALPSSNVAILVATQALSAPLGFALAAAVSARLQKLRAYVLLYAASLIFVHGPLVLRLLGVLPHNGAASLLPILLGASAAQGILTIAASIVNTSMISDVVEENQARTARRSEGLVLFSDRLMLKLAGGLATVLPGILLTFVAFPAGATARTLDPEVMRRLALTYIFVSLTLSGLAILTWRRFRIDHAGHLRNLAVIEARRSGASGDREA
jgi:Na+/melibiose symporter-like transporter